MKLGFNGCGGELLMHNMWESFDIFEENIEVKIVKDSISEDNVRVTTMLWRVPRFLLPQLNTYRMFSRNVSSCLTGDNKLYFDLPSAVKRGTKSIYTLTLEEIYNKWVHGDALGKNHKNVISSMNLRYFDVKTSQIKHTHIRDVRYEGMKEVYKVTLVNGKMITLTSDHRIMTADGWKTLNDMGLVLHPNFQCSWFKNHPKIATNGQEITYDILANRTLAHKTATEIAEEFQIDYEVLKNIAKEFGIQLYTQHTKRKELASYRFKHVLSYHIKQRHHATTIASMYGTNADSVKKAAYSFGLKFDFFNRDDFIPWNKGKKYKQSDVAIKNMRIASKKRLSKRKEIKDRTYQTDKIQITTWLNTIRSDIYKKFDYKCYLCGYNKDLHLHHIYPVSVYPERSMNIENICLLCRHCHKDIHKNHLENHFINFYTKKIDEIEFTKQTEFVIPQSKGNKLIARYSNIKSIEYMGVQKVYDIEVDNDDESFVCNGVVVHNSRAKRFSKTVAEVKENPYIPYVWQSDHSGMQTDQLLQSWKVPFANLLWKASIITQTFWASCLSKLGVSKQYTNRLIEAYMYVDYLITATDFENFLLQRDSYHAQLEIQVLARRLRKALENSKPDRLAQNEWHLPFISEDEKEFSLYDKLRISVARCARTSYVSPTEESKHSSDYKLFKRLANDIHLSPFEHQVKMGGDMGGNLQGVTQLRKILEYHLMTNHDFDDARFSNMIENF